MMHFLNDLSIVSQVKVNKATVTGSRRDDK
jgi:hypothetical protein